MITKPIKTNVITGFLGVGKTTLIKQLLAQKPAGERWAVLVNEFGQVGIDAGLLDSPQQHTELLIKQVPGGCMCCAAGLPTKVAINQIIQQLNPDRLLIEPTGLGHPKEILRTLQNEYFKPILSLGSVLTLIDARKLADSRYTQHDIYIEQAKVADVIIASKSHLCTLEQIDILPQWLADIECATTLVVDSADYYQINNQGHVESTEKFARLMNMLDTPSRFIAAAPASRILSTRHGVNSLPLTPDSLFKTADDVIPSELDELDWKGQVYQQFSDKQGQFYSLGWIFAPQVSFGFDRLMVWVEQLRTLNVVRFKAVVITYDGILGINYIDGELQLSEIDDTLDSRMELIGDTQLDAAKLEQDLLACMGGH
ncbi:GTP-binding protein [Shewanella intestini]|uniref:GTP-binding protein n=1 Tax=Shewanella intestini TaxID=2017544 RepID=A0ABS5HZW6_9GAMM|nr:GTP-binding protein [Shewanella intestini]MRG35644.1 GTP-binding protein [Shewanella sp. XMDDZSB0408]